MSKKAKEVVEAVPKFAQPWQGFLSFGVILLLSYVTLEWFVHPVWGILTRMVQANAFVASTVFGLISPSLSSLGILYALNNPNFIEIYPMGYIVDWVSYFVFCIVWFVAIGLLARPFTPAVSRLRKQPWAGLIIMALSMIFAFLTWYILAVLLKWRAWEMIVLGTSAFLIFPIWVTLFSYWPFLPKRPGTHWLVRGAFYVTISWVFTFLVRGLVAMRMWSNSLAVVGTQYLFFNPFQPLTSTEPYDFLVSILFGLIVGSGLVSQLNLFPSMAQPKRGLVNLILAVILGLIVWGIITLIIGPSTGTILLSTTGPPPVPYLVSFPYIAHSKVGAYLGFPLITVLAGQLTFSMWPWAKYGKWAGLLLVIVSFIIGSILYYVVMIIPGIAGAITGGNLIVPMSGLQTIYLSYLAVGNFYTYTVYLLYFEGLGTITSQALMFTWLIPLIFYLLAYEGFEHWPWK